MAVPPQALPFWIMLGELATGYDFCGTVITVPYKCIVKSRRVCGGISIYLPNLKGVSSNVAK